MLVEKNRFTVVVNPRKGGWQVTSLAPKFSMARFWHAGEEDREKRRKKEKTRFAEQYFSLSRSGFAYEWL